MSRRRAAGVLLFAVALVAFVGPAAGVYIPQTGDVTYNNSGGPTVTLSGSTSVSTDTGEIFGTDTVKINSTDGKINFTSTSATAATVTPSNISDSTWTNLTAIDATAANLQVDPGGMAEFKVGKQIDTMSVRQASGIALDDGVVDFAYSGSSGESLVEVSGLPANTAILAKDADSGTPLSKALSDGSGVATFDDLDNSQHNVTLQSSTTVAPEASNLKPSGTVRFEDQTLSVDVSDADFAAGDTLTAELILNGTTLSTQSTSSNTTLTTPVTGLPDKQHNFTVKLTDSFGETDTETSFFTVDHFEPVISNESPTGNLQQDISTLSVDINDSDFPKDGDSVTVRIKYDGTLQTTQTLSSNGTASATVSSPVGGQHSWTVNATDQYGNTNKQTFSFIAPADLEVFEETDPDSLVTGIDTQVRFFGPDAVFNKTTGTSGTINMTDLPVASSFVVRANPPSGSDFESRRIFVESIYEQQSIYLLNATRVPESNITIEVSDQTGSFDQPVLEISRPLTKDFNSDGTTTTEFKTISGDNLNAADEYPATLETDVRYRVRVTNGEGDVRELGNIVPRTDRLFNLQIEGIEGNASATTDGLILRTNQSISQTQTGPVKTVQFELSDATEQVTEVQLTVHEAGNSSNVFDSTQFIDQTGVSSYVYTQLFSSNDSVDTELVANYTVVRGGETVSGTESFGSVEFDVGGSLSSDWGGIFGVGLLIVLGGLFSVGNARIGALVVPSAAFVLHLSGLISAVASAGSIGLAFALAVAINLARTSGSVLNK